MVFKALSNLTQPSNPFEVYDSHIPIAEYVLAALANTNNYRNHYKNRVATKRAWGAFDPTEVSNSQPRSLFFPSFSCSRGREEERSWGRGWVMNIYKLDTSFAPHFGCYARDDLWQNWHCRTFTFPWESVVCSSAVQWHLGGILVCIRELKQQQQLRQRKLHLKTNVCANMTIWPLFLLVFVCIVGRARYRWTGRSTAKLREVKITVVCWRQLLYLFTVEIYPLSTCLIVNFSVPLPQRRHTTVSLETNLSCPSTKA